MTEQRTQQAEMWPPHNGTETSREAAASVVGVTGDMRRRVLRAISAAPNGLTCDDVEVNLGMPHQTASARINELARLGAIRPAGSWRRTRSGRRAIVWVRA